MEPVAIWSRAADWVGVEVDAEGWARLHRYRRWLLEEGIPGGGLGRNEGDRVDARHLADSIVFAAHLPPHPDVVVDVGSGIGLPGIPLAIVLPATHFHLVERSGRRASMLRRVRRILGLENVSVHHHPVQDWKQPVEALVSRATFPPHRLPALVRPLLRPGGVAVIGGSWERPPVVTGLETVEIPAWVLDQPVWLLIMRAT